jgi:glyoxylase-like metal-dependent hydrolase (beta-lactamase superfamily II)
MPVFFRTVGTVRGPSFFVERGGRGLRGVAMSVTVAVVERADGLVLIDTGWSRAQCAFPDDDPGLIERVALGMSVRPEDAIASQLISCGYDPADVRHVVATHLHRDHFDGARDFPNAEKHVAAAEWAVLETGRRGYSPSLSALPRVRRHAVDGPAALGFPRSADLFGDGSVLLLDARGHTAGSVAVAVALDDGWVLHAGDAAMFARDFREDDALPPSRYMRFLSWDLPAQRRSYGYLREAESAHGARVLTSHDHARFDELPHTKDDAWALRGDKRKGRRKG